MNPNSILDIIHFDGLWKSLMEIISKDFVLFFVPELYEQIDFTKEITFLKQDLPKIFSDGKKKGDVIKDNMMQVHLKNGKKELLLIHVETEAGHEKNFSERMFVYFYRSHDKYPHDVTALAIFLGQQIPTNYNKYTYQRGKAKLTYEYPTYIVRDQSIEELQNNSNPFALAVLACKYVLESRKEPTEIKKFEKRLALKVEITEFLRKHCEERKYSDKERNGLISFVLNILLLPPKYEKKFHKTIFTPSEKTQTMQPTSVDISFANSLMEVIYGETGESLYKKLKKQEKLTAKQALLVEQLKLQAANAQKLAKQVAQEKQALAKKAEAEKQALAKKAEVEKQALARQVEAEKQALAKKAEVEKQALAKKAEAEKQALAKKAEAEKQALARQVEVEKQALAKQVEQEKQAETIQKLHQQMKLSVEQIATFMELSKEEIERILA